jgi:ribonucleoside-diphosphate reductase alpha chain
MQINVIKRDGRREPLSLDKIHRVVSWACEGLTGVSPSEIELKTQIQFTEGMKTSTIQETLIKAAADLISEDTPNYQYVAGRLINYHLRKTIYDNYNPPRLYDIVKKNVADGWYEPQLLEWYSEVEFDAMDKLINHSRDDDFTYVAMEQWRSKYLVRNRINNQFVETPQVAYMLIGATLFHMEDEDRMQWVKDFYELSSTFVVSLPTPIMAGVRTDDRQFSSCVLIDAGDDLHSICAASSAIKLYVSQRAGIGLNVGRNRGVNEPVRKGRVIHTGITPYIKSWQADNATCSQGGVRKGSSTFSWVGWHKEFRNLIVLKNNKGTEETRARQVDYCVQLNKVLYERLLTGGKISFFSPNAVPGMYEAFFTDVDKFRELYEAAENNPNIPQDSMSAQEFFETILEERKSTGRIYIMHVDHANDHGAYIKELAPIFMTNLCVEILQPTKPLKHLFDPNGEISLCTLSAHNWGVIKQLSDFEKAARVSVRALDNLLTYQDYPVLAAELTTRSRRQLGVGIINLAYWMAKNGFKYDDVSPEALAEIHRWAEAWSYYLIRASCDLAKERGACDKSYQTKYHYGVLPIDTYKKDVDQLVAPVYYMPWEELREDLKKYGIRNSTLMALMPSETSSQISNATNGIEPVRGLVSVKGVSKQVVPEIRKYKNAYDPLWEQKSPLGYLKINAVLVKFLDQAASTNVSYNPMNYEPDENGQYQIPMTEMLTHQVFCYKYGIPTEYYFNTYDGAGEVAVEQEHELLVTDTTEADDELCPSCAI